MLRKLLSIAFLVFVTYADHIVEVKEVTSASIQEKDTSNTEEDVEEVGIGTSEAYPMRFIMPVESNIGVIFLETWNSVSGTYKKDQEWTLHGKITAKYTKTANTEYEVGLCIQMNAPYTDSVDCLTIKAGQAEVEDQNVLILHGMKNHTDYTKDTFSQSWETEAAEGEDGTASEVCDSTDLCTMTFRFKRDFATDEEEQNDSTNAL